MKRKILISIITMIMLLSIGIYSFAMGNVTNNIRGFVGGTENIIENMVNDATGGVKSGLNTIEGGTENVMSDVKNGMQDGTQNAENTVSGAITNNNANGGYTASMTSTDQGIMGSMNSNMWTWLIVAVLAVAIGLMIWAFARNRKHNNMYIDPDDHE